VSTDADATLIDAAQRGDTTTVEALLAAGADPAATSEHGVPALAVAVMFGHAQVTQLLLRAGADPDRRHGPGMTALMVAGAQPRCAELLIEAGADVNARADDGAPVITAVLYDGDADPSTARLLLAAGADPTVPDDVHRMCALDLTDPEDRALFREFGFDPDERPGIRAERSTLLASARREADRLGWELPGDPSVTETRYTCVVEVRPASTGGWTDEEFAAWKEAEPEERERIGIVVRDRTARRDIRLDATTAEVLGAG